MEMEEEPVTRTPGLENKQIMKPAKFIYSTKAQLVGKYHRKSLCPSKGSWKGDISYITSESRRIDFGEPWDSKTTCTYFLWAGLAELTQGLQQHEPRE